MESEENDDQEHDEQNDERGGIEPHQVISTLFSDILKLSLNNQNRITKNYFSNGVSCFVAIVLALISRKIPLH
jgi:hypothetical protein